MAKTLFFAEALAFALLAVIFPLLAADAVGAFILPVVFSLVIPLAAAVAVWPPRSVLLALAAAFSPGMQDVSDRDSIRILDSLAAFSRSAAVLGFLFAIVAVCARPPLSSGTWTLLGAFLSAYALLNAELWSILAKAVGERSTTGRKDEQLEKTAGREAFLAGMAELSARYGLTPRERETAALIANGRSYKEAAFALGISIKTVKVHMSRVYEKTGSASNVGLALLVRSNDPSTTKVQ